MYLEILATRQRQCKKRKLQTNLDPQQNISNQTQEYMKKIKYQDQWSLSRTSKTISIFGNQSIQSTIITTEEKSHDHIN